MTQKELDRLKAANDPTFVSDKERAKSAGKKTAEQEDEEEMFHWIWNSINPTYKTFVPKGDFLAFLQANREVRDVFNLKDGELVHIIESIVTREEGFITYEEFEVVQGLNRTL